MLLMNMVRISKGDEVLVLEKPLKYGWEGKTFPGGKVKWGETFQEAAIREVKEETNLVISQLQFHGTILWYEPQVSSLAFLYSAKQFYGEPFSEGPEGKLYFQSYEDFLQDEAKSASMDEMLSIYQGEFKEIYLYYDEDQKLYQARRLTWQEELVVEDF